MEWIITWINGISDTWIRIFALTSLIISLIALGVGGWQMYMSRSRYKELKKTQDDLGNKQDRALDYLRRKFDVRIEADTKFNAPEMTVSVGKRQAKKPTLRLTFRRWLRRFKAPGLAWALANPRPLSISFKRFISKDREW